MPIYAYRCDACGHAKDVLRKVSDPLLGTCPACGAEAFKKQITAAGFQLKGSGWYATDFRNGGNAKKPDAGGDAPKTDAGAAAAPADAAATPAKAPAATGSGNGSSGAAPAVSAAASGGCGGPCACH